MLLGAGQNSRSQSWCQGAPRELSRPTLPNDEEDGITEEPFQQRQGWRVAGEDVDQVAAGVAEVLVRSRRRPSVSVSGGGDAERGRAKTCRAELEAPSAGIWNPTCIAYPMPSPWSPPARRLACV
jgi:hypothetical protein